MMTANANSKRPATKRGKSQAVNITDLVIDWRDVLKIPASTFRQTREERFETACRRKRLDPVAVGEDEGPGVAINRTGRRVYVQIAGRFKRVPLAHSVFWFETIFRGTGWTTFDDGYLRWLRVIGKTLEAV